MMIERILVPTDFSVHSLKALKYATDLAREHQSEVVIVHVIEPMNYAIPRWLPEPTALLESQRVDAARQLARIEQRARRQYPKCRAEVHFGVVYEVIAQVARKLKADIIVLTTHGRTGLAHIMMGSVAERVLRTAPCPVLVIRSFKPPRLRKPADGSRKRSSSPSA